MLRTTVAQDARQSKAASLLRSGAVHPIPSTAFTFMAWVRSQSQPGIRYLVTLGTESCTCPDYAAGRNAHLCKHILACRYAYIRQFEQETAQ